MPALRFRRWIPLMLCLLIVAFFSSQSAEEQDLSPIIGEIAPIIRLVRALPHMSLTYAGRVVDNRQDPVGFVQFFIRKTAHAVLYAAVGFSFAFAIEPQGLTPAALWLASAAFVVLVGSIDELRQAALPGRNGLAVDVCIDLGGFMVAYFIRSLLLARRRHARRG